MLLMLVGNAGIITAVSSLMLAFIDQNNTDTLWIKIVLLISGLVLLWTLASSHTVDRFLSRLIDKALKHYTSLEVRDFASLLGLSEEYRIVEIVIEPSDWLAGKTLEEVDLREEGVVVLAIQREKGTFLGTPDKETPINRGDTLIVYGHVAAIQALNERRHDARGNREHKEAVSKQEHRIQKEQQHDKETLNRDG
jgi:K+/H+ antiporter YhaU regulatory subunit KhtT